jgi:hypothetical protein
VLDTSGDIVDSALPLPRWTIPSFRLKAGRYPLGIESVNFGQLDELASGLPVLSQHPRYWSAYTFIVKRFWDLGITPQTNPALGRFLRPHEIVFASASLLCQEHGELPGILGRNTLAPFLRPGPEQLSLDLEYLDQSLGGYGQVYRGAMADLGLVLPAEANPKARVDAPMGQLGTALAEAFAASIAGTTYAREHLDQTEGTIPIDVIRELGEASCFHRLAGGGPERDLLVEILTGTAQSPHPAHRNRAASIRMFLDLARATEGTAIDERRFRRLVYWGQDDPDATWRPSESVVATWRRWWLVQHRELVVSALNALFIHVVLWGLRGGGALRELSIQDWTDSAAPDATAAGLGVGLGPFRDVPIGRLVDACDEIVRAGGWPMDPSLAAPQEDSLLAGTLRGTAPDAPSLAFAGLVLALRRVKSFLAGTNTAMGDWSGLVDGGDDRVSTARLVAWLTRRYELGGSVGDAISDLVRLYVVRQHLRIARGKLPDDTFRFHDDGGGLRFVDQGDWGGLNPISIRFNALTSSLSELGLVAGPYGQPGHGPTVKGYSLLDG